MAEPGDLPWPAPLPREFFDRPATSVAPELLGCVLVHELPDGLVAAEIVEVEAYMGSADPPSHAFRGKTARNEVMFGEPGHAYVYFTYGMHFCVNLVCGPPGEAAAVLLRAGRVVEGAPLAAVRRSGAAAVDGSRGVAQLASGPARLCQALGIARAQNGADVCDPGGALRVLASAESAGLATNRIATGPRVGVSTGAEVPWRFWIEGDPSVSAYRAYVPRRRTGAPVLNVTAARRGGSMQR
jgi:DNA-3-methyladenine glycosylase